MIRKLSISLLIVSFSFSSVNAGWATQTIDVSPIIVQPYDWQEINEQMLEQDRINRDQELAIRGLIDDNQKLAGASVANEQNEEIAKINETMEKYRDYLISRDQARIAANSQKVSKYYDLIKLTEYVDDEKDVAGMKAIRQTVQLKSEGIEEKAKALDQLKDEMTALNEKLKSQSTQQSVQVKDQASPQQEMKIQLLTQRLAEMDQRIAKYDDILAEKDQQIMQLKGQVGLLKSELENKITEEKQIAALKVQSQELSSKEAMIKSQADQINKVTEQFKDQSGAYTDLKNQVADLRNKMQEQANDLQAKNASIEWLHKVLAVVKDKSTYYQLTSQKDQMTMQAVQGEVDNIKGDFAQRLKDYDQFEKAIGSLKIQVSQLSQQLSEKQQQADLLKSELNNKIAQADKQSQEDAQVQQDLKGQLRIKEDQIVHMKADILAILQDRANKEIYLHNASVQLDDRVKLAKELIDLQAQEASLLNEKSDLEATQSSHFEEHTRDLESKIRALLVKHQIQALDVQNRLEESKEALAQKEQEVNSLKAEIENKISEEKDQAVLSGQIQDLKAQIQAKDDQIASMQTEIQSGKENQEQVDAVKEQLAQEQSKVDLLKQELESKDVQSDKMTAMVGEYQKKLESKNGDYDQELQQVLAAKNEKAQQEKQIADLNIRLQQKEAQVVKIKKDMYELEELSSVKDRDVQANDLSLSMVQEKAMDEKIKEYEGKVDALHAVNLEQLQEVKNLKIELALAHQQLVGVPSNDEIEFLRTGLQKATVELQQKDETILRIKSNADEYAKEFKKQTKDFQSLTGQLLDAQQALDRKTEDLKYKDMELIRFKEHSQKAEAVLKAQVKTLTDRINNVHKGFLGKIHENKVEVLQEQLMNADEQIKDLQTKLDQVEKLSKNDAVQEKLKQALNKIDEQGVLINSLAQKLQDAGKPVDLTHVSGNE